MNTRGDRKTPGGNAFSADRPSWALTEKARSWTLHTNRGQDERGARQTRATDEPAPALTGKSGGQWHLRMGNQKHACVPDTRMPAPTIAFGHNATSMQWCSDRPSTTIAGDPRVFQPGGHHKPGEQSQNAIHITVEEALILQGFDRSYPVQGNKTQRFGQVGNCIPPPLAEAILRVLR